MILGLFIGSTVVSLAWVFVQHQQISDLRCTLSYYRAQAAKPEAPKLMVVA